ncbi:hypothetical protein Tco_0237647 [Tanacetum coccineum]
MAIIVRLKFRLSLIRNHATIKPLMSSYKICSSLVSTCYSGDGSSFTYDSTPNFVDDSPNVFNPPSPTTDASPPHSELVSLEDVKDFHPEDGELEDDILCEKLSKINLLIAKIEALKDNLTLSSDFVTKSPSTSPNSFLEETNISYNSLPEVYEDFLL